MVRSNVEAESPPTATVVTGVIADVGVAANDETAAALANDLRNPLWIIAIGMAWFFGIVASVIAVS